MFEIIMTLYQGETLHFIKRNRKTIYDTITNKKQNRKIKEKNEQFNLLDEDFFDDEDVREGFLDEQEQSSVDLFGLF